MSDVLCIGNALVDVLSQEDDDFVAAHGIPKDAMRMVDAETAERLYGAMGPGVEVSGGSAANTAAGIASLGGRVAFVGKVADDELGRVFTHDLRAAGVEFETPPLPSGPPTGRSLVVVTPDAHRSMSTFLGASEHLTPDDVDPAQVEGAAIVYSEGYLWDQAAAKDAIRQAAGASRRFAFSLSDPFCVERHRREFLDLVATDVDVLFANEAEIVALYEASDFEEALRHVRGHCELAALTRSERGSVIVAGDAVHEVAAHPVGGVVDTTGAGDLYAAGVLYGLTHGFDLARCGALGSLAAGEVISHLGARPQTPLTELAASLL